MRLNPKEQEKLMLHMAGNLAKERKERKPKPPLIAAVQEPPRERNPDQRMNRIKITYRFCRAHRFHTRTAPVF